MTFNEFQRELRAKGIEGPNAYMFTLLYERMIDLANDQETNAKATLALAETLGRFVDLHRETQGKLKSLERDAVVKSEPFS